jgi:hypothetical protein
VNGDGSFDTGDVASQTSIPGDADVQVFVGQWKSAAPK